MKRIRFTVIALLFLLLTLTLSSCSADYDFSAKKMSNNNSSVPLTRIINPDSEVRGVWIASVFNIDFPSSPDLTPEQLKNEIDSIISICSQNGINTIFFQVRPSCDALYESEIFPVSKYLSSDRELTFDPLGYIVKAAHENNIFVHAWVNPLRVSVDNDLSALPDSSPAKEHPEWVVEYGEKLYFDVGIPEVRALISDGVREIVKGYDVDGVVFDDYFYPYPVYDDAGKMVAFDDDATFALNCGNFTNVEDWRRSNVNEMIRACYDAVHETDSECVLGVSPFGVWQNDDGENGGSETANLEAYTSLYCDALAWADGGYIDYLSPQIYWAFDTKSSPYDVVLRWWNSRLDGTGVKLYVSHALHNYNDVWTYPEGEISEQITYARSEKTYRGSVCYGYSVLKNNIHGAADELKKTYSDEIVYTDISSNGLGVVISSPNNDSVTYDSKTYIVGSCDPAYPLTLDGKPVSMTKSGYFSMFLTLSEGKNVFVFSQNGKEYEFSITYKTSADPGDTVKSGVFSETVDALNIYPTQRVATSDDTLWVECYAPLGSKVSTNIGGIVTELHQISQPIGNGTGYECVLFGGEAELPKADAGTISDCGEIKISVSHRDGNVEKTGANVRVLGEGAQLCVRAKDDYTELKITETSLYYNDYTVQSAGMTDYADGLSDGFYHLRMGGYVYETSVEEINYRKLFDKCKIKSVKVTDNGTTTDIVFSAAENMPYNACIDEGCFVITLYNADSDDAPAPKIEDNPFFDDCTVIRLQKKARYSFPLFDIDNFYGFDLTYGDGSITVSLRDPEKIDFSSPAPLDEKVIVLDAGHGGYESGAVGAKQGQDRLDEEDVNLLIVKKCAEKLSSLGADVRLTRSDDSTFTLYQRMDYLEETEPDLCVSIHQNSDAYSKDITRIRGTLGLWCMDSGVMLAECVSKSVASSLGRMWQDSRYQMLAMCRNPKFPSALIEVGYMTSVEEYEYITSEVGLEKAASGVVEGIIEFFRRQGEYYDKSRT